MLNILFKRTTNSLHDTHKLGKTAEDFACHYLKQQGLKLLARNFSCRHGELDLIMQHKSTLVFIEVRLRNNRLHASGIESIDYFKQQKLIRTAKVYLQRQRYGYQQNCRFDVLDLQQQSGIFKPKWIQHAFIIE